MEDGNPKKPLRQMTDKEKDIYNTYVRHEGGKTIPISGPKEVKQKVERNDDVIPESETLPQEATTENIEIENLKKEIEELRVKIESMESEKNELYDQLLRKAAEFENFRRRTQKEKEDLILYGNEKLLQNLLPILDDLNNAVVASKQSTDFDSLVTGLEMILQKTKKLFEQAGVSEIDNPVGKPFDFELHEALMNIPSEVPEGYVVQELQKGYKLFDKVIRHTKVVTSAGLPENDETPSDS
jgi:molecular chaperone GrpE